MSDFLIVFLGFSAAVPCLVLVYLATRKSPQPSYRNPDYDPHAQRGLPREPTPVPTDFRQRVDVVDDVLGALIHADRKNQVPQLNVRSKGIELEVTGGKGVKDLVERVLRDGTMDLSTRNRTPRIHVIEDPTLFKKETWLWDGTTRGQSPPSSRWIDEEE